MLTGSLTEFPFLGVLQMLLNSGRSGLLRINNARAGDLYLEHGEVVHATAFGRVGNDALDIVASGAGGSFTFELGVAPPDHTIQQRRDALLQRLWQDGEAWTPLNAAFPDWDRGVRFTSAWNEQMPVTRAQYRALSLIGRSTLSGIISSSSLPPRELLTTLRPFVQARLIELV